MVLLRILWKNIITGSVEITLPLLGYSGQLESLNHRHNFIFFRLWCGNTIFTKIFPKVIGCWANELRNHRVPKKKLFSIKKQKVFVINCATDPLVLKIFMYLHMSFKLVVDMRWRDVFVEEPS